MRGAFSSMPALKAAIRMGIESSQSMGTATRGEAMPTIMVKRDCQCPTCRAAMNAEFKRIVRPLRLEKINARRTLRALPT